MSQRTHIDISPEWEFYFCTVEDKPASIMLNLALFQVAPIIEKSEFIQVTVNLNEPNEHGLTTQGEAEILYVIEDQLADHLAETLGGLYVGRSTGNKQRIFYFYCNASIGYPAIIEEVMEGFGNHSYICAAMTDVEWAFYKQFLYPSPSEYQSILNRRVIENLEIYGDRLTKAREIEHFLYFPTEYYRSIFIGKIQLDKFNIVSLNHDETRNDFPYSLVISRVDRIDNHAIDELVLHLVNLSQECEGNYDGWGTAVIHD